MRQRGDENAGVYTKMDLQKIQEVYLGFVEKKTRNCRLFYLRHKQKHDRFEKLHLTVE